MILHEFQERRSEATMQGDEDTGLHVDNHESRPSEGLEIEPKFEAASPSPSPSQLQTIGQHHETQHETGGIEVISNLFFGACGAGAFQQVVEDEEKGAGVYVLDEIAAAVGEEKMSHARTVRKKDEVLSVPAPAENGTAENGKVGAGTPERRSGRGVFGTPDKAAGYPLAASNAGSLLAESNAPQLRRPASQVPSAKVHGATNELHRIAKAGDWATLRSRLTSVANHSVTVSAAGQVDEKGRTPLMLACLHGSKFPADVARLLLVANNRSASVYVLQKNNGKQFCLHVATSSGCSIEVLDILQGAFPRAASTPDGNGNMPLHLAVNNGRYRSIVGQLGARGEDLDSTIISEENRGESSPARNSVTVENSHILSTPSRSGYEWDSESMGGGSVSTASILGASPAGYEDDMIDVCEFLITANPSALLHRNRRGETPLLLAIYRRSPSDVLSLLLVRGGASSVKIADDFGSYPLHFCDRAPSMSIVKDMGQLYPEAIMNKNKLGNTPLYCAMADSCGIAALRILLECCPRPRDTVESKNGNNINILQFGWDDLNTPKVVAAEDQDEEDARLEECKNLIQNASDPSEIAGKYLGDWWAKATLLLQGAYHNTIMADLDGLLAGRVWRPVHAVAGTECPSDMVKFVLRIYANEAGNVDENNNTPLHIGASRPDIIGIETMKLLLDAHPFSAMVQNNDGYSPLHVACLYKAPLEILELLLRSSPDATCLRNKEGQTPLLIAISVGSSVDVLRALLDAKPNSVHVRDVNGMSSIALAWLMLLSGKVFEERGSNTKGEVKRSKANISSLAVISRSSSLKGDVRSWMSKIDVLLRASFHGTVAEPLPKRRQWRAVHAACSGGTVPPDVLAFALQILPSEADVVNERGNLPLHIAASAPPHEAYCPPQLGSGVSIELLLKINASGAKRTDRKGRLPLHLALKSGKTWENGVKGLVDAFPESTRMRDPESLLYPFMLAACSKNNERKDNETDPAPVTCQETDSHVDESLENNPEKTDAVDLAVVNTIYVLLRDAPKFISESKSDAEIAYLWRTRNELLAETEHLKQEMTVMEAELHRRMTPAELQDIEDRKKREISRKQEEERRVRANHLELSVRKMTQSISDLASSMMLLKDGGL